MQATHLPQQALRGFAKAVSYDQYRPSYPPSAVAALLDAAQIGCGGHPARVVLDLAAGTGKFTEQLVAATADDDDALQILAVEPHEGMRHQLAQKGLRNVTICDGLSASIPAPDGSMDAVFAAQSFHWFADEPSLIEIHRVLKLGAMLALIWNVEDYNSAVSHSPTTVWETELRALTFSFDTLLADTQPRYRHEKWRSVFNEAPVAKLFDLPLTEKEISWTVWLTKEELWSRYATLSQVAIQEGDMLENTKTTFTTILSGPDVERNSQGQIAVHGRTVMAWTQKKKNVSDSNHL